LCIISLRLAQLLSKAFSGGPILKRPEKMCKKSMSGVLNLQKRGSPTENKISHKSELLKGYFRKFYSKQAIGPTMLVSQTLLLRMSL
jgi:hypothetical protein